MEKRDLDLLYEVSAMRFIDRNWVQFHRPNVANVAEHSFRVAWIAQILALGEGADVGRVLQMALMHDVGKSRAGDGHWMNRMYMKRDEAKAIADTTYATSVEQQAKALWNEFKSGETLEAKIVKDADNIDVDIEFRERREDWHFARTEDDIRRKVYETKLQTASAKQLWEQIQTSDPHDWYVRIYHTPNQIGEVGAAESNHSVS
jgi:putative hydrolase of HD superfamily